MFYRQFGLESHMVDVLLPSDGHQARKDHRLGIKILDAHMSRQGQAL